MFEVYPLNVCNSIPLTLMFYFVRINHMKKILLFTILVLCLVGCASTKVDNTNTTDASIKENTQTEEKLPSSKKKENQYYDDWKYKGFGQALPTWINDAVYGKSVSELKGCDYIAKQCHANNLDQAESSLKEAVKEMLNEYPDYYFYDSFWVKLKKPIYNDECYVSIAIYTKDNLIGE